MMLKEEWLRETVARASELSLLKDGQYFAKYQFDHLQIRAIASLQKWDG